ncbi:MAG: fluoride efflux transporter CrcB [Actinobacteria bacterium]|nr:fluoride efflux transporter CrcB [Actinomycetota bacterium]MCA1721491.1 fluoride efflux transporter CrcB [Actinomycetota bacterium]
MTDPDLPPRSVPLGALLAVVAVGGALGALARYAVAVALPDRHAALPVGTLLVNVVGCLLLGVLVARCRDAPWLRPFLGTGVLGGFTTFSTFAVQTDHLLVDAPAVALLYVALSVGGGLLAAAAGLRVRR